MAATFNGGSHQFNFNDANFTSIQGPGPSLDALSKYICADAIHDSSDRCDAPKCHENTRVAIQNEAVTWLKFGDGPGSKQMRWISGPAGEGKTAIMGSVAETLHNDSSLAASFFFSATSSNIDRRFKRFFIPTLAYQLAQHPTLGGCLLSLILAAVSRHPELSKKNLDSQAKILILGPVGEVMDHVDRGNWPKAIVVDGLDECRVEQHGTVTASGRQRTNGDDQLEVLQVLAKLALHPAFPFRILIASRPDPAIHNYFEGEGREKAIITLLDDTYSPDKDIELYLEARFTDIRRRYNLGANWPSRNVVPTLVTNASGQFAYPSVVMRFIDDEEKIESPVALLEIVMRAASSGLLSSTTNPLAALDAMYTAIVCSTPNPLLCVTWIQAVRWAQLPPFGLSKYARYDNEVFEEHPGEVDKLLAPLRSLIKLTPGQRFKNYSFYHKSFLDYLDDPTRIGPLYVGRGEKHMPSDPNLRFEYFVVRRILRYLSRNPTGHGPELTIYPYTIHELWAPILQQNPRWLVSEESDLFQIDVQGWAARVKGLFVSDSMGNIYTDVHAMCTVFRCTPVCKHWRLGICKGRDIKVTDLEFLGRLFGREVKIRRWRGEMIFLIF